MTASSLRNPTVATRVGSGSRLPKTVRCCGRLRVPGSAAHSWCACRFVGVLPGAFQHAMGTRGRPAERLVERLGSVFLGEDLDTPRPVPPGGAQGRDHGRQVEEALPAVPATMDGIR